jgi:hypothetical protein
MARPEGRRFALADAEGWSQQRSKEQKVNDGLISLGAKLRQLAESMPDAPAVT